jgi:hypothetical protein
MERMTQNRRRKSTPEWVVGPVIHDPNPPRPDMPALPFLLHDLREQNRDKFQLHSSCERVRDLGITRQQKTTWADTMDFNTANLLEAEYRLIL